MSKKKTSAKDTSIKIRLYKNNSPTAAQAPYLAHVVHKGTRYTDDIIAAIKKEHPNIDEPTFKLIIDMLFDVIRECLREGYKVNLPSFGLFESHITGTFDSFDAPMTPGRNELVVKITPSASLRKKIASQTCEIINTPQSDLALNGVETPSLGRAGVDTVAPGADLTITGRGFGDGTLAAAIVDAAEAEHPLPLSCVKSIYAQGTAPTDLPAGDARFVLKLTDADDCTFIASRKITIVAR